MDYLRYYATVLGLKMVVGLAAIGKWLPVGVAGAGLFGLTINSEAAADSNLISVSDTTDSSANMLSPLEIVQNSMPDGVLLSAPGETDIPIFNQMFAEGETMESLNTPWFLNVLHVVEAHENDLYGANAQIGGLADTIMDGRGHPMYCLAGANFDAFPLYFTDYHAANGGGPVSSDMAQEFARFHEFSHCYENMAGTSEGAHDALLQQGNATYAEYQEENFNYVMAMLMQVNTGGNTTAGEYLAAFNQGLMFDGHGSASHHVMPAVQATTVYLENHPLPSIENNQINMEALTGIAQQITEHSVMTQEEFGRFEHTLNTLASMDEENYRALTSSQALLNEQKTLLLEGVPANEQRGVTEAFDLVHLATNVARVNNTEIPQPTELNRMTAGYQINPPPPETVMITSSPDMAVE